MATLVGPEGSQNLRVGEAVYLKGDVTYTLENQQKAPVVYIAAEVHSAEGHQH